MTEFPFDIITSNNINQVKYVKVTGHWRLSEEIDEFELYVTFRGVEEDYEFLADTAFNIYFGDAGQIVQVTDSDSIGIATDQIPDWARLVFDNISYIDQQDNVAVYQMNQIEPSGRRVSENADGKKYGAGIRKNSKRYSDFATREHGFAETIG